MKTHRRIIVLIIIMAVVALVVAGITLGLLYRTTLEQAKENLEALAQSQARLLEAVARFDQEHSQVDIPGGAHAASLTQIQDALEQYQGIGETGEYVLGMIEGDQIKFLLRQRMFNVDDPLSIPLQGELDEPMRLALMGESGSIIAHDYSGTIVLAAYEPVEILNLGIVAKMDMDEITAPFIKTAWIAMAISGLIIALGTLLFFRFSDSIVRDLEKSGLELSQLSQRLKLATESAGVGIWDWDVKENILVWDDTMYLLYGIKAGDFSGAYEAWVQGLHPEDKARSDAEVGQALEGGKPFDTEFRVIWPDSSTHYISGTGSVFFDTEGAPERMIGVNWDITERKHAEQKIRSSEARLRAILDHALDGIITIDESGTIQTVNPACESIFGYSEEEMLGQNVRLLMPDPYHSEHDGYLSAYRKTGEKKIIGNGREVEGQQKDGTRFPLDLSVSEYWIDDQRLFAGLVRDISVRKNAEHQLNIAKEGAEAANLAKSNFLANMSHELRTPMNAIIGFSELLEQKTFGDLNTKQDRFVDNIHSSGKHLLSLINDILDISKVEAGRLELDLMPIDVDVAIHGVVAVVNPLAAKKSVTLNSEISPGTPSLIADPAKFKQILYNLLSNAIKFTPDGGEVNVQCKVTSFQSTVASSRLALPSDHRLLTTDPCLLVTVSDSGIGLLSEDLERVFVEFEQVDSSYAKQQEGTGLGLTLTRKLSELHGGWVWAESEGPGKGSIFSVLLPLAGPEGTTQPV
jgi:PAS domain S-box-containing protein